MAGTTVELLRDKKVRDDSTTGETDVNLYRGKCKAVILFQGKTYCLGIYKTLEEAAAVRKKAEKCLFGEFLEFYDQMESKGGRESEMGRG